MATFVGGMGSSVVNETTVTAVAGHGLGAPAASVAAPAAPAADPAPVSHEAAAGTSVPFVGGMGSLVAAPSTIKSFEGQGLPALAHADAAPAVAWFAPAPHLDSAGIHWFAGLAPNEGMGSPGMASSAGTDGIGIGAMTVSSVFSSDASHGWDGGMGDGSYATSELPFMHGMYTDTVVYTASNDTEASWLFTSDFSGDFFIV